MINKQRNQKYRTIGVTKFCFLPPPPTHSHVPLCHFLSNLLPPYHPLKSNKLWNDWDQFFFVNLAAFENHVMSKRQKRSEIIIQTIVHIQFYTQTYNFLQAIMTKRRNWYRPNCFLINRFMTVIFNKFCIDNTLSNCFSILLIVLLSKQDHIQEKKKLNCRRNEQCEWRHLFDYTPSPFHVTFYHSYHQPLLFMWRTF